MLTNLVSSPSTIVFVSVERALPSRCSNRVAVVTTTLLPLTIDNSPVSLSNTTSYSPCLTSVPLILVSVKKRHLNSLALGKRGCAGQSNKQESNHNPINYCFHFRCSF